MEYVIGIILGCIAALMMNVGKGVQKQKVQVLKTGRKILAPENRKNFFIWLLGIIMTSACTVPYTFALKLTQAPSVIASLTGVGLVGLVIYALAVIKEKMGKWDVFGIVLVVIGTSALGYLGESSEAIVREYDVWELLQYTGLIILFLGLFCIVSLFYKRLFGIAFGLFAGCFLGTAIFLGDVALVESGGSVLEQLKNPYPYLAILSAILALTFTQLAFFRGRALEVVPCINSIIILTPLILEGLVYEELPSTTDIIFISIILLGVLLLSFGAAAKISAAQADDLIANSEERSVTSKESLEQKSLLGEKGGPA